jgi:hypothetical protein
MRLFSFLVVVLVACPSTALAGRWGHWRGPTGNGTATQARPPVEFGAAKNVRWKVALPGSGSSSPVVWDEDVFVTAAVPVPDAPGEYDFRILCFDRGTGREKWSRDAVRAKPHEGTH